MTKRKHLLKDLQIDEISFVDRPANPRAVVTLFKRDDRDEAAPTTCPINKAAVAFTKRVDEIRFAEGCSGQEALRRARMNYPDEFAAYQEA